MAIVVALTIWNTAFPSGKDIDKYGFDTEKFILFQPYAKPQQKPGLDAGVPNNTAILL